MKNVVLLIAGISVVLLTACGGSSPSDVALVNDILKSHELTSFEVVGTDVDTPEGKAPINPGVNNGEIRIKWSVREQYQNTIKLVVSEDNVLSDNDIEIFFSICNLALPCGQAQVSQKCTFSSTNNMVCGFDSNSLGSFLSAIPKNGFIIIESCFNAFPLLCDTRSADVQFQ